MPYRRRVVLLAASLVLCAVQGPAAFAQDASPAPSPSPPPFLGAIIGAIPEAMLEQHAPGMVLALTDRHGTIAVIPFGAADREHGVPVTAQTRFGIGSITKSMTAIALLQARDRGRFDPHAPVTRYLPWFRVHSRWRPLTGHDLLTHTSGLPDGGLGFGEPLDSLMLRDQSTGYAPGTHWTYSNVGYETLGAIAEAIDHRPWSTIVHDGVLAPLGMSASATDWTFDTLARSATGYLPFADDRLNDPRGWTLVPAPASVFVDPAGSVLSTGGDMARYARMLLNGGVLDDGSRLISPSSYALLTRPAAKAGGNVPGLYQSYAYGLAVAKLDGDAIVGHTGGTTPYVACLEADLTTGFAAVALTNVGDIAPRPCAIVEYSLRVLRAAQRGTALPAFPAAHDPAQVEHASALAGVYHDPAGQTIEVVAPQPDRLALVEAGVSHPLLPAGSAFWTDIPRYQYSGIRFLIDPKAKRANELIAEGRWYATTAYRGRRHFPYPKAWDAYPGFYRTGGAVGSRPYDVTLRVQLVKGALVLDDGTPLVPLPDGSFRVGAEAWSPERVVFDSLIDGQAQRAVLSGVALGRVPMP